MRTPASAPLVDQLARSHNVLLLTRRPCPSPFFSFASSLCRSTVLLVEGDARLYVIAYWGTTCCDGLF